MTIYNIIFILFCTLLVLFSLMYISKKIMKYEEKKKQKQLEILHSEVAKIGCGNFICGSKKCESCNLYYDCRNEFFELSYFVSNYNLGLECFRFYCAKCCYKYSHCLNRFF